MSTYPVWLSSRENGCDLRLHVVPRSTRTQVDGQHGDRLKLRLNAPPVDGKANQALQKYFAKLLGCPASSVKLLHGETGREKTIHVPLSAEQILGILSGSSKE